MLSSCVLHLVCVVLMVTVMVMMVMMAMMTNTTGALTSVSTTAVNIILMSTQNKQMSRDYYIPFLQMEKIRSLKKFKWFAQGHGAIKC